MRVVGCVGLTYDGDLSYRQIATEGRAVLSDLMRVSYYDDPGIGFFGDRCVSLSDNCDPRVRPGSIFGGIGYHCNLRISVIAFRRLPAR